LKNLSGEGVEVSKDLLGNYDPRNCDMYINVLGSFIQDAASEEGVKLPQTILQGAVDLLGRGFDLFANFGEVTFTDKGAFTGLTVDPSSLNMFSGAMMIAEPIANAYLKNRTRRLVDPTNKSWSHADKVLALRQLAQESAEQYIRAIDDFKEAATTIKTAPRGPSKAFEALLKYCLAQEVYYNSHTGQMLEDAGIAIGRFRVQLHIIESKSIEATSSFIASHASEACTGTACCYGSLLKALAGPLVAKLTSKETTDYAITPCQRVNEKNELDAVSTELVSR